MCIYIHVYTYIYIYIYTHIYIYIYIWRVCLHGGHFLNVTVFGELPRIGDTGVPRS